MYRKRRNESTGFNINESISGETIETKIERIVNNGEPITDGAPIVYTERKDGVMPGYNIRTDRFEVALDAMEKITKSKLAGREERGKIVKMNEEKSGKPESTQGTEESN